MFPSSESIIVRGGYRSSFEEQTSQSQSGSWDQEKRINAEGSQILHTKAPPLIFNS